MRPGQGERHRVDPRHRLEHLRSDAIGELRAQHGLHDAAREIHLQPLLGHLARELWQHERKRGFNTEQHQAQHKRRRPGLSKGADDQPAIHRPPSCSRW